MSRIDAALRRARTGLIDVPPPPALPPAPQATKTTQATQRTEHASEPEIPLPPPGEAYQRFSASHAEKVIVSSAMPQALREQYRRLAAALHHAQAESGIRVLMVTSAVPDEGKTLTATNIALTLSESYHRRVLLIDADLRRPSIGDVFQIPKVFGLNEALSSVPERKVSVIQVSQNLSVLTAGAPDPDPMSALTSERMRRLLSEAAAVFDWVVIDTPPVGILTDAKLLGAMADAALLVIRAGKTPAALIQRAVEALGRNRILGVVLNRTEVRRTPGADSYYNSYYYGAKKPS